MGRVGHENEPGSYFAGSEEAPEPFADVYDELSESVLGFFAARVRDSQAAFDLTAGTFAKAFEKRHAFRGGTELQVAAWIWSIARNELAMYRRRRRVEVAAMQRLGLERPVLSDEQLREIEALGATEQAREQVRSALSVLPAEQQEVMRMRFVEDRSYREIANVLGVSHEVVRARASRALRRLKSSERVRAAARWLEP